MSENHSPSDIAILGMAAELMKFTYVPSLSSVMKEYEHVLL
ncbi:hypothetical protein P9222_23205 [Paenibacillus amylolyticus]|nr:hypothetical protein [Paenibacillus amylolyticus]WFR61343.1 hypothetical protein P9222_23205 [Paenibacillus amylolyticus]